MKIPFLLLGALAIVCPARAAAGPADATKVPLAAKKEEPARIEGIEVARAGGGFLGVAIVEGTFKISFYDDKKKPVKANVVRALLRWDPKGKIGQERVVLNLSADGKALTSPRTIRPPYVFKLFITLLQEAVESAEPVAGESYTIDFRA